MRPSGGGARALIAVRPPRLHDRRERPAPQALDRAPSSGFTLNTPSPVIGDWFRIDLIHNGGGLFGLFQGSAPASPW
jgi:hypothetical protein